MPIIATVENDTIRLPDGIHLPDGTPVSVEPVPAPGVWPPGYFERTSGALAGERFERPPQGETENRAIW